MKILFVLPLEVNPKTGGVERVTYVLTQYFLKAGIGVNFFYFNLKQLSFPEFNEDIEVFFPPDIINVNSTENILFLRNVLISIIKIRPTKTKNIPFNNLRISIPLCLQILLYILQEFVVLKQYWYW